MNDETYKITVFDNYILMEFFAELDVPTIETASKVGLELSKEKNIKRMCCDISKSSYNGITMALQVAGIRMLWSIRHFERLAMIISDPEMQKIVRSTMAQVHMTDKYRSFPDKESAVAWLEEK